MSSHGRAGGTQSSSSSAETGRMGREGLAGLTEAQHRLSLGGHCSAPPQCLVLTQPQGNHCPVFRQASEGTPPVLG